MSHDQNFKNLILDYPREALAFFAEAEAARIDAEYDAGKLMQLIANDGKAAASA